MQKTSREYWNSVWTGDHAEEALDPSSPALLRHYDRSIHHTIQQSLQHWGEQPKNVLEVGCGGSLFLPYFARFHQVQVSGLDYSPSGCESARRQLQRHQITGQIVEGDIFSPPSHLVGQFDLVFSMGVFEHFTDTAAIVQASSRFLRPGGLMISIIPNMNGVPGWLQRTLHPTLFDMHVPLTAEQFASAHGRAGLDVLDSRYVMTCNPYVVQCARPNSWGGTLYRIGRGLAARLLWGIERLLGRSCPNAVTSPYVLCVARNTPA